MGKLLITSGGYLDGQRGLELDKRIEELSAGKRVLIVTNATSTGSNIKGVPIIKNNFQQIADMVDLIHLTEENIKQIKKYDVLYITGGDMAPLGEIVTEKIKDYLINFLSNGGIIIGESAGSIIFGEDFKWYYDIKKGTKPKYDVKLSSYKGFGFIEENIYPHYNKASEQQKTKIEKYEEQTNTTITKMNDGEWVEEIFLNNNIEQL